MFEKFKDKITDLAYSAVNYAENALSTSSGKEKKQAAIAFVISRIPVLQPVKPIVVLVLSKFIDTAIEKAVAYMNEVRNEA